MQANSDFLELEVFDLREEIFEILKRYEYLKETECYEIEVSLPNEIIVKADKKKLEQVIYNLINNAINYTGDDKKVRLNITEDKKEYLVEVIDTGKGIDNSEIDQIWNKYYKKDKNHRRNVVGTGLGLSIVKEILEKHKMVYGVKSVKNRGTTFYFKISKFNNKK